jgi:hypothetical protein
VVPPAELFFIRASAAAVSNPRTPNWYMLSTMIGPGSPVMTKVSLVLCDHFGSRPPCWPSSTMDRAMSAASVGARKAISAAQDR